MSITRAREIPATAATRAETIQTIEKIVRTEIPVDWAS